MRSEGKRQATVFPEEQKVLSLLGENIRLAMKRRRLTQTMVAERTGISRPTLRNIERGEPTVSIGHYLRVLAVLGLEGDLGKVAADDELGRKLQDIASLRAGKANAYDPRRTKYRGTSPASQAEENSMYYGAEVWEGGSSQRIKSLMEEARRRAESDLLRSQGSSDAEDAE